MTIIQRDTYSPTSAERLDEYLIGLSNHIERCVRQGGDPRGLMADTARRAAKGHDLQNVLAQRFAKTEMPTTPRNRR